ncbi:MAG: hypothetical protein ABFR89_01120 [Actinomycetota bacterium]
MRLRRELVVLTAVVFATIAVAANVFAVTRAHEEQARLSTTTMVFAPIPGYETTDLPAAERPNDDDGDRADGAPRGKAPANHGQAVRAFLLELHSMEALDGPPGALIRTIAKPDGRAADDPPRSARAQENLDAKEKDPPGRSRDH